jgi:DNA-binding transcriptional LysR family regulator
MDMAMELRHLRYFVAVAEEGHITRAAERLSMQQPPLSQQIRALERELDVQLLRRKARGVELTDAGHAFLTEARAILAHLDRAHETTRRAARGEQGRLCVGVTSTSPFHPLVPRTIRQFQELCPMVSLVVEECLSNESVDRLSSERMDVAFIRTAGSSLDGLAVTPLLEERMVVALPDTHELAQGKRNAPVDFERLASETFILYGPPGTGMYDSTIAACHAAGFNPRVGNLGASTQQAPRIASTLSLVAAGLGISVVPSSLQRMNMDGVVYRALKGAHQPKALLNLASRRGDPSAVVRQFLHLVRRVARDLENAADDER